MHTSTFRTASVASLLLGACTGTVESSDGHARATSVGSTAAVGTSATTGSDGAGGSGGNGIGGAAGSGVAGRGGTSAGGASGAGAVDAGPKDASAKDGPSDAHVVRDVYVADRNANAQGILIHVENGCPFNLWIRGTGGGGTLQPDNAQLVPGQALDYIAPDQWNAARVTAYGSTPPSNELDKVEMTLGNKVINYNITYVDWVGLPIEIMSFGTGPDCKRVGCYLPHAQLLQGCPDGLLSGQRCVSAGSYCLNGANQGKPFCHALDQAIAQCGGNGSKYPGCAPGNASTADVYSCRSGTFFGTSPKWCAALNRGMLDEPDNGNAAVYYTKDPYNAYARWVHATCPGIYAFPYDDYGHSNESGFHSCTGGRQLNITFCPSG